MEKDQQGNSAVSAHYTIHISDLQILSYTFKFLAVGGKTRHILFLDLSPLCSDVFKGLSF